MLAAAARGAYIPAHEGGMAQVVSLESVPLIERPHVREGVLRTRRIVNGDPGTPGNFSFQCSDTPTYYSPRHRHNFDQMRYQLEGDFDFATDGMMKPGTIGYFPEGTYYGPQSSESHSLTLVLQFGGASGSGYISAEQYECASAELAKLGTFSRGVYTRMKPDGGKINQDAYEAVWERVNGKPLVYPGMRYARPVFIEPENFDWIPVEGEPGVDRKHLGEFSERRTRIALYRVAKGSTLPLDDDSIYFAVRGAGWVDGSQFKQHATIRTLAGENARAIFSEPTELLHVGLPQFS